jgi:hypothetical protein
MLFEGFSGKYFTPFQHFMALFRSYLFQCHYDKGFPLKTPRKIIP